MTEKITRAEFLRLINKKGRKAPAKNRCRLHPHGSASEGDYCLWMQARQQNGEIESYKWQVRIEIAPGQFWAIDFGEVKKGEKPAYPGEVFTAYHESKGWNQSDQMSLYKLRQSLRNYPKRAIFWNKQRVPPLDSAGRLKLRKFYRKMTDKKAWAQKIKKMQAKRCK